MVAAGVTMVKAFRRSHNWATALRRGFILFFAIAFGLGGREPASRVVQRLLGKAEEEANKPTPPQPQQPNFTPPASSTSTSTQSRDPQL